MRGLVLTTVCPSGLLTYLVLFSLISLTTAVSFDLTELRNKVSKIKVNPRANLWATGHFMGKKSVMDMDNPLLPSPGDDEEDDVVSRENDVLGNLFQEVLRLALKAQLDTGRDSRSQSQEKGLLKILQSYIQSSRM